MTITAGIDVGSTYAKGALFEEDLLDFARDLADYLDPLVGQNRPGYRQALLQSSPLDCLDTNRDSHVGSGDRCGRRLFGTRVLSKPARQKQPRGHNDCDQQPAERCRYLGHTSTASRNSGLPTLSSALAAIRPNEHEAVFLRGC